MAKQKISKDQKRKKKLAERKKKEVVKLQQPHAWAVHSCYISEFAREEGNEAIIQILLTKHYAGNYLTSSFLVDLCCMGVKDCMTTKIQSEFEAEDFINYNLEYMEESGSMLVKDSPKFAYAILQAGVNFASKWGFSPKSDFSKAKRILPPNLLTDDYGIDIHCGGLDGKPLAYISPYTVPLTEYQKDLIDKAGGQVVYEEQETDAYDWGLEIPELRFDEEIYGKFDQLGAQKYTNELVEKFRSSSYYKEASGDIEFKKHISENFDALFLVKFFVFGALKHQGLTFGMAHIDFEELFFVMQDSLVVEATPEDLSANIGELALFSGWLYEEYPDIDPVNLIQLYKIIEDKDFIIDFMDCLISGEEGGTSKQIAMAALEAGVEMDDESQLKVFMEAINEAGGVDNLEDAVKTFKSKKV
ncbi:MAG: hypothetical protein MK132_25695 [Lentisphaerales bacterium]|nr:hypothetical protein [Lentisphaerales bacterium]